MKPLLANTLIVIASALTTLIIVELAAWGLLLNGVQKGRSAQVDLDFSLDAFELDRTRIEQRLDFERERAERLKGRQLGEKKYQQLLPTSGEQAPIPYNFFDRHQFDEPPIRRFHAVRWTRSNDMKIYDVTYTVDRYFRRQSPLLSQKSGRDIVLFGGSFTFGEGLDDQDTLANRLMVHGDFRAHTMAYFGYGPSDLLRNVLKSDLNYFEGLPQNKIDAVYVMPDFHVERALGPSFYASREHDWAELKPHFKCRPNGVEHMGPFSAQAIWPLYRLFHRSAISRVGNVSFPLSWKRAHFNCLAKILGRIRQEMAARVQLGRFYVVLYPKWHIENSETLIDELNMQGFEVIDYSSMPIHMLTEGHSSIPLDQHPNALNNDVLAQFLARDL